MELKYFRLIKTIAEEGSIANSSEKLFLTQSAISHQLKDLENQLGFKVFYRKRNQWELTEEGTALYKLGNTIITTIDDGFKNIKKIQNGSVGTIRVSTECYSFYQGLPSFIQKMAVLYPKINVDLTLEATHKPVEKVLSNELDIAIVTSEPESKLLKSIPFFNDEIFAIIHQQNVLNKLEFIDAKSLAAAHLIIHSYPLETVSVYEQFLKPNKAAPFKISAVPLTEVALEMVEANFGILCMPKWTLKSFKLSKDVVFKKLGKQGLKRQHYLVIRKEDESKKYINDFITNFIDEVVSV